MEGFFGKTRRWLPWLLWTVYCLWMLWLLFGQRLGTQIYEQQLADRVNLVPFSTVGMYFQILTVSDDPELLRHAVINLAGNVVMFIPLGIFLPCLFKSLRGFFKTAMAGLTLIFLIELLQYITALGACDVDDLLLNMVGVLMGYPVWRLLRLKAGRQ